MTWRSAKGTPVNNNEWDIEDADDDDHAEGGGEVNLGNTKTDFIYRRRAQRDRFTLAMWIIVPFALCFIAVVVNDIVHDRIELGKYIAIMSGYVTAIFAYFYGKQKGRDEVKFGGE